MDCFAMPFFMKKYFLFTLFTVMTNSVLMLAQNSGAVEGNLTDKNQPLPFVNLVLRKLPDSLDVKWAVANDKGQFFFEGIPPGNYYVEAAMMGYQKWQSKPFPLANGQRFSMGNIAMESGQVNLKAVVVEAQKPFLIVEPDKMVVRVADNPLMINSNALDVLKKSPGVMVNQDDQIFLLGKSGLQIFIDGRPSPLSEKDLANWLRSIPSGQIENIEIITNPSARYDASGNAGIINIKMKKNTQQGFNGSWNSGFSNGLASEHNYAKTNHSVSVNKGGKKTNLFANLGYDYGKSWNFMDVYREQSGQRYDQQTDNFDRNQGVNGKIGLDFKWTTRHALSLTVDGNRSENKTNGISQNFISDVGSSQPYRVLNAGNNSERANSSANFNFNHTFKDTSGRELFTDANYGIYQVENVTRQPNFYQNLAGDSNRIDRSFGLNTPVKIGIATLKSDFEQKKGKSILGAGYKISNVLTDNDFGYFNQVNGANDKDLGRSSNFTYQERVLAGYLSLRHRLNDQWSFQAGVRMENTFSRGQLHTFDGMPDSTVERQYINWFPSAGVTYSPGKVHRFIVSYSRRIDRPVYRFLNPFQYKLDELSYEQGNPFLNPQYTDNYQLTHSLFSTVTTTIGYSRTTQFFARVIDSLGNSSFLTRRNLADVNTFSANLSSPLPIRKWWNGFFNFTYSYRVFEANFGPGKTLNLPIHFYNIYLQQSFSLPGDWSIQCSGYYNSPNVWGGTFKNRKFWSVEAGLTKKVFNKKGTISLNISDIFLSQRWFGDSDFGGILVNVKGGNDSRQIRVGFSYQFGKQENKPNQRRSGNNEERQRLRGE